MAAVAVAISGVDALSEFLTTELQTVEETRGALKKSSSDGYRRPGEKSLGLQRFAVRLTGPPPPSF
jgi:hypothetical protein